MAIPDEILPFWQRFEAALGSEAASRFCEAFHFDC